MKGMSHCEKFVIEGNKKADELAKAGAIKRGSLRSLALCSQLPLHSRTMERL